MKINDFAELVLDGIHPVVEFKKGIEDFEGYAALWNESEDYGRYISSRRHH